MHAGRTLFVDTVRPGAVPSVLKWLFWSLWTRVKRSFEESVAHALPHLPAVGWVGLIGFPLYGWIWTAVYPQPYENALLRGVGAALFAGFVVLHRWPEALRRALPLYWFVAFTYALPFFFTFMLLHNGGNLVWSMSMMAALALLILVTYDWMLVLAMYLAGSGAAWAAYFLTAPEAAWPQGYLVQLPIYGFLLAAGAVFNYKALQLKQERLRVLAAVGGEIAHELRTPLLTIANYMDGIADHLPALLEAQRKAAEAGLDVAELRPDRRRALQGAVDAVRRELDHAQLVIDLLLMNVGRSGIDPSRFAVHSARRVIQQALERYPFASEAERARVHAALDKDFSFRGSDVLLMHVLFNLLRNSLRQIAEAGRGRVRIWCEPGPRHNRLCVLDTATGMSMAELAALFEPVYVPGRRSRGAGLGLAFCKRVMRAMGGRIVGRAEPGRYCLFELRFPPCEEAAR